MQCHDTQTMRHTPHWQIRLRKQEENSTVVHQLSTQVDFSFTQKIIKQITQKLDCKPLKVKSSDTVDICFTQNQNPDKTQKHSKKTNFFNERITRLFMDSFLQEKKSESVRNIQSQPRLLFGSVSGYKRAHGALKRFIGAVRENLDESLSFFNESGNIGTFERILAEIREVMDMEFMRLNSLSESSGEEASPDMEMFRSRTESTQNGFSMTSETFGARAKMSRDFNMMKHQIENSLNLLKKQVNNQVSNFETKFRDFSKILIKDLTENEIRVQNHLANFEVKMEGWTSEISDSSNANNLPKNSINSQKNLNFITLMNKERGFTFGNQMHHISEKTSKTRNRMRGKSSSSEEPTEHLLQKCHNCSIRKSKTNFNSLEDVNSLQLLQELKARGAEMEAGRYIQKLKHQISSLNNSKHFSSGDSDKPGQLNFGFFLMSKGSEENTSVYDSSMTHRLLDALLDDKINTTDKWVQKPEEFSKTTNPKSRNLKEFLGIKSNRNLNKTDDVTQNQNLADRKLSPAHILTNNNYIQLEDLNQEKRDSGMASSDGNDSKKYNNEQHDLDLNDLIHIPTDEEVSQYLDEEEISKTESLSQDTQKSDPSASNSLTKDSGNKSFENKSESIDIEIINTEKNKENMSNESKSLKSKEENLQDKKSIENKQEADVTRFKTFETHTKPPKIRISKPELPEIDPDFYQSHDHKKKNPFMATDKTSKNTETDQIAESEVINSNMNETMTSQTLMESFRRRKQTRLNSFASKRSVSNGPDDWRQRLGGMIDISKNDSSNKKRSSSQNLDVNDFKNIGKRHLRSGSKYSPAKPKINPPRKMLKNTLKSLVFQTGKKDTELLKAKLEKNQASKSNISKSGQLESVNETISQIMDQARKTVLLEDIPKLSLENSRTNTDRKNLKNKGSIDSLEKEGIKRIVEEMSRQRLEEKMMSLCQELMDQGLDWKNVEGSLREKIKTTLTQMKKAVEKPFEKLVEKHVSGLEDMKEILDKIKMENIQLEYGMIKLSEAYNQVIQTLKDKGIQLEIPAEHESLSKSDHNDNIYSREVNEISTPTNEKSGNLESLISPETSQIPAEKRKEENYSNKIGSQDSENRKSNKSNDQKGASEENEKIETNETVFKTQSKTDQNSSRTSHPVSSKKRFYEQFSLKEFRDEIRERVEFEKSKLDSHLREITESGPVVQFTGLGIDSKADTVTSRIVVEDSRESAETFSNPKNTSPDPLDLKIPEPKEDPALFQSSLNQRLMRHKSFKCHKSIYPLKKRFSCINQSSTPKIKMEVTPTRTPPGRKRRTHVVIDLGQEKTGNKRRMIKTVSGVIKTVGEMKEEYYNTKKWNVDLLMENQDLVQVNNKLNSDNLTLEKKIAELKGKLMNSRQSSQESDQIRQMGEGEEIQNPNTQQNDNLNETQQTQLRAKERTSSRKYDALEERLSLEKERYQMLEQDYQELVDQNAQLLSQSKEMTNFWVENFRKVTLELKETREDLDFLKREISVELQLLKGKIMVDVVEKLKETNQNLNLFVFMNEKLEKERASIRDCIFKIQAVVQKREERRKTNSRRSRVKTGYMKIGELCNVIGTLCGSVEEEDPTEEKKVDYTKIIYSDLSEYRTNKESNQSESFKAKTKESSLKQQESDRNLAYFINPDKITESESELTQNQKSHQPTPSNQIEKKKNFSDVKINVNKIETLEDEEQQSQESIEGSMVTERTMHSENEISDLDNYQINYDNSDMGRSSTEEEEFDNGMDVLLKEYMTEQMANRNKNTEGVRPPYNTVQDLPPNSSRHKSAKPKIIDWAEGHEVKFHGENNIPQQPQTTSQHSQNEENFQKIDIYTPLTTQELQTEMSKTPTSINNYKIPGYNPNDLKVEKTNKKSQQDLTEIPGSKVSLTQQIGGSRNRITLHKIRDDSSIEEDDTESRMKNKLSGIYMDRESGFEDITERLIGVVSLEDKELREEILHEYRKIHRLSNTSLTDELDEEMLQSLRESADFKTRLIEDLPEEKKKSIAIRALIMLRGRLGNDEDDLKLGHKLTESQSISKSSDSDNNNTTNTQTSSSKPTQSKSDPNTETTTSQNITVETSEDHKSSILKTNPNESKKTFSGSRKSKSIVGESVENSIKLERIKKENKFLVAELEERNKKIKHQTERIENLETQNFSLQEKVEALQEEVVVYQQRMDFFEKENLTEAGSEYGDGMSQFDMMSQRLSNHMKVIQEEDEEDEEGSLISGYRPSQQNFNFKIDQASVDNESHFSFYKDEHRSEIDYEEGDAESIRAESGQISGGKFRMGQTFIKKIQRRATTRARTSFQKEALRQHLENFHSPKQAFRKHNRKSVGTFGVALQRKRINKSESLNQSLRNSAEADLERVIYSQGRTKHFDTGTNDSDSQKISFGKLIESGVGEEGSLPGFHSNQTEDFGLYTPNLDNPVVRDLRLNSAPDKSPSPIISYISEEKIGSGKFDYSKNFEEHISSEISGKLADLKITDGGDSKRALSEGVITRKAMSPRAHKSADIIKELKVVTVISFSTGESERQVTIGSSELPDNKANIYQPLDQKSQNYDTPKENEKDSSSDQNKLQKQRNPQDDKTEKKIVGSESRAADLQTVKSVTLVNVDLDLDNSRVVELKRKISAIKESFVNLHMIKILSERTMEIEKQITRVGMKMERVKKILSRSRQRRLLEEFAQRRQFGENDEAIRKKGFTNQFDSERSGEYSVPNTPGNKEIPDQISEEIGLTGRVLFGEKKDFKARGSHQGGSPFGKKPIIGWQGSSAGRRRSKEGHERLMEIEQLKLRNALETERDKVRSLEQELYEGRQGLERLLESMPRKVKQSPLLKVGEKHFREVLELVTFQVEEYQEEIQQLRTQRKEVFLEEYERDDSDEGPNTEELIGSSVLNTRGGTQKASSSEEKLDFKSQTSDENLESENDQIENEYGLDNMVTFEEIKRKNFAVEEGILVREDEEDDQERFYQKNNQNNLIYNKHNNMIQYSNRAPTSIKTEPARNEMIYTEQISDSDLRSLEFANNYPRTEIQLTESEKRSRQIYQSCTEKRGEILLGRLDKRQQRITKLLEKAEKEGAKERKRSLERAKTESLDIVEEVKVFLHDLEKGGYETEYKNLYGKRKETPQNDINKSEDIRFLSEQKESEQNKKEENLQEFKNEISKVSQEKDENSDERNFYSEISENPPIDEMDPKIKEAMIQNESEGYLFPENEDGSFENDIDDMIADLLEVIYNEDVDYPEKIKVIKIFLHHTYDLIQAQKMGIIQEQYANLESPGLNDLNSNQDQSVENYKLEGELGHIELEGIREDEREDLPSMEFRSGKGRTPYTSEGKHKTTDHSAGWRVSEEEIEMQEADENKEDSSGQYEAEGVGEEPKSSNQAHREVLEDNMNQDASVNIIKSSSDEPGLEINMQEPGLEIHNNKENDDSDENFNSENDKNSIRTPLVQSQEGPSNIEEEMKELRISQRKIADKNLILQDEIRLMTQRINGFQNEISILKKRLQRSEKEKRNAKKKAEMKSHKLEECLKKNEVLKEEIRNLQDEFRALRQAAEERAEEWQLMEERLETLKEVNQQLASQNELRSHEYGNSSSFTGLTPIKTDSKNEISPETENIDNVSNLLKWAKGHKSQKTSIDGDPLQIQNPPILPEIRAPANNIEGSEYPQGFGVKRLHDEKLREQQEQIEMLTEEKKQMEQEIKEIHEDSEMRSLKYNQKIQDLKMKISELREASRSTSRFSFKKKLSSCRTENELRKRDLQIHKMRQKILKLQDQLRSSNRGGVHGYHTTPRLGSGSESRGLGYQRSRGDDRESSS